MKQITKLLNSADVALGTTEIRNTSGEIKDVNKGYVSGFGPAVINSGLIPALAFYISDNNKRKIINAIALTLGFQDDVALFNESKRLASDKPALNLLREKVVNASIALKLMMRTYKVVESDKTDTP